MKHKHCLSGHCLTPKNQPGQTLVEFALVFPFLLLLLLGFFDLGRAFFYRSSLTNAVREGARAGIVMAYNEADLIEIVESFAFGLTNADSSLTITPSIVSTPGYPDALKIEATYCYVPVMPGFLTIIGSNCKDDNPGVILTATSVMMLIEP